MSKSALGLIATTGCCALVAFSPPSAMAAFPGRNGDIAVTYNQGQPGEGGTTANVVRISPGNPGSVRPVASPSQMDAFAPAFSPDGRSLAFSQAYTDGFRTFGAPFTYVLAPGTGARQLSDRSASDPAWSPTGQDVLEVDNALGQLTVVNVSTGTSRLLRVTAGPARLLQDPAWSTRNQIAFSAILKAGSRAQDLYVLRASGGRPRRLTHGRSDLNPSWSPDGRRLVFARRIGTTSDLYVIRADGSGLRRLTRTASAELDPVWSPDGRQIAFVRGRSSNTSLYAMSLRSRRVRRLATAPDGILAPDWQPLIATPGS